MPARITQSAHGGQKKGKIWLAKIQLTQQSNVAVKLLKCDILNPKNLAVAKYLTECQNICEPKMMMSV